MSIRMSEGYNWLKNLNLALFGTKAVRHKRRTKFSFFFWPNNASEIQLWVSSLGKKLSGCVDKPAPFLRVYIVYAAKNGKGGPAQKGYSECSFVSESCFRNTYQGQLSLDEKLSSREETTTSFVSMEEVHSTKWSCLSLKERPFIVPWSRRDTFLKSHGKTANCEYTVHTKKWRWLLLTASCSFLSN